MRNRERVVDRAGESVRRRQEQIKTERGSDRVKRYRKK